MYQGDSRSGTCRVIVFLELMLSAPRATGRYEPDGPSEGLLVAIQEHDDVCSKKLGGSQQYRVAGGSGSRSGSVWFSSVVILLRAVFHERRTNTDHRLTLLRLPSPLFRSIRSYN